MISSSVGVRSWRSFGEFLVEFYRQAIPIWSLKASVFSDRDLLRPSDSFSKHGFLVEPGTSSYYSRRLLRSSPCPLVASKCPGSTRTAWLFNDDDLYQNNISGPL